MTNYIMYLRKSRSDSEYETVAEVLAKHETQLQEYAIREFGYRISEDYIYREVVSGETIEDRPKMSMLLQAIESKYIKGVITIEPQRLTRGDLLDCGTIVHAFRYTHTLILTPMKTYDLDDKYDRKFFEMELTRGNDYLEYTKEILNRGRLASVKAGNYIGNIPPYGYDKAIIDKHHTLVPNNETYVVQLIYNLFANEEMGYVKIARHLDNLGIKPRNTDKWSHATIRDILSNQTYTGKVVWNRRKSTKSYIDGKLKTSRPRGNDVLIENGKHKAIIEQEIFEKVQTKFGTITREPLTREVVNPLSGLLFCKNCGTAMSYRTYKDRLTKKERSEPRFLCNKQVHCHTKSSPVSSVYRSLITSLSNMIADFTMKLSTHSHENITNYSEMITNFEKSLVKLDERQEELFILLEDKIYSKEIFIARNSKLREERETLLSNIKKAKDAIPRQIDYKDKIKSFKSVIASLNDESVSAKQKNILLKSIIKRIDYYIINDNGASNINIDVHFKEDV